MLMWDLYFPTLELQKIKNKKKWFDHHFIDTLPFLVQEQSFLSMQVYMLQTLFCNFQKKREAYVSDHSLQDNNFH